MQEVLIDYVEEFIMSHPWMVTNHVIRSTALMYHVPFSTAKRWYKHYLCWGEYPHETKTQMALFKKKYKQLKRTNGVMTDEIINAVNNIITDSPEFYIDEIMQKLAEDTGI